MIVLFDTPNSTNGGYSHLVADTIENLHEFAGMMGLKKHWFQNKRGKNQPHYDIKGEMIEKARQLGAKQVSRRELVIFLRENYC